MTICTQPDEFIQAKVKWVVELEDGSKIYQDDGREDEDEPKAWIRLGKYVKDTGKNIVGISVQFWDHVEKVADKADGYYYIKSVSAYSSCDRTFEHFVIGTYDKNTGNIQTNKWLVPEILNVGSDVRTTTEDDPSLIINPHG
jgi:hypothetical protein